MKEIQWGAQGELVYNRTYSRIKPDGSHETWPETVERVVDGNLALVPERHNWSWERRELIRMMTEFKILPAGRHLWASGVSGAEHLFNCWVTGWWERPEEHFSFLFLRLMEGGGVGSSYSNSWLDQYPEVTHFHSVEIVCDPSHPDYEQLRDAGVLSDRYSHEWAGAFPIEDSREGWADALTDLIQTYYREDVKNFYRVYDVSRVRPAGAPLRTFGGTASGPLPLAKMLREVGEIFNGIGNTESKRMTGMDALDIDHAIAQCVVAGGVRRSARMSMMHWNDPQIEEFCRVKAEGGHWTTNISVEVDRNFWDRIHYHPGSADSEHAFKVLDLIAEGAVLNGEPGMWDSSVSNFDEPNRVVCTNPCGEITLEPAEPCNLGHVNLQAFVRDDGTVDLNELDTAHELMTRFLIRATFSKVSDPRSREVLDRNRRIGVGHLGVAGFLALTGRKLSEVFESDIRETLDSLYERVRQSAIEFCNQLRIPVPVKLTTVAPTGSISKLPGVSEGIHPIFSKYFIRRIRLSKLDPRQAATIEEYRAQGYTVEDDLYAANTAVISMATKDALLEKVERIYGPERAEELVESADQLSLQEQLDIQWIWQNWWADNAVSFTANLDPSKVTAEDVREALIREGGFVLKGTTIFPEASMPQAPYERITKEQYDAAVAKAVADGVDENCANGACPIR